MNFNATVLILTLLNILIILGVITGFIFIVVCTFKINKGVRSTNYKLDEIIKLHEENTTSEKLDQVLELLKKDIK